MQAKKNTIKTDKQNIDDADYLKKELSALAAIIVGLIIIFKIAFASSPIPVVVRVVLSLSWMFLIPGYILMRSWRSQLPFLERVTLGIGLQAAILGILSYYLVLLGWQLQSHGIFLPAITIGVGILLEMRRKNKKT